MNVQFVSNSKGKITAVQMPLKDWKEVEKKLEAFKVAESIRAGYNEMKKIEAGEIEAKTLEELLNELQVDSYADFSERAKKIGEKVSLDKI